MRGNDFQLVPTWHHDVYGSAAFLRVVTPCSTCPTGGSSYLSRVCGVVYRDSYQTNRQGYLVRIQHYVHSCRVTRNKTCGCWSLGIVLAVVLAYSGMNNNFKYYRLCICQCASVRDIPHQSLMCHFSAQPRWRQRQSQTLSQQQEPSPVGDTP